MKQGEYVRSECTSCEKQAAKQLASLRRTAPPKTKKCWCCFVEVENLILDHNHDTGKFRGWLCRNCNQGIGKLGDNIEGLQKAMTYLKRATREKGNQLLMGRIWRWMINV